MFDARHGSRRDVAHICMVITDGVSRFPQLTAAEADELQKASVDVFAIGMFLNIYNIQRIFVPVNISCFIFYFTSDHRKFISTSGDTVTMTRTKCLFLL